MEGILSADARLAFRSPYHLPARLQGSAAETSLYRVSAVEIASAAV